MDTEHLYITYEMSPAPPAIIGWEEYEALAAAQWQALLAAGGCADLPRIRDFLIKHPSFVPGATGALNPSRNEPCHSALLALSPLREWITAEDRYRDVSTVEVPDFIWLAHNSEHLTPVLIKIESPGKKWFTDRGDPHDDLLRAINHLREWQDWLSQPRAITAFHANFDTPSSFRRHGKFRPDFVLIYGREGEFKERPRLARLRSQFQRNNQIVVTFDGLKAARDCAGYICISQRGDRFRALSIPPTMRLGPSIAGAWHGIDGFPDAVMANEWISPERKQFLIERLPYWQRWATSPKRIPYYVNLEDWE
jgi:hypothetical protein